MLKFSIVLMSIFILVGCEPAVPLDEANNSVNGYRDFSVKPPVEEQENEEEDIYYVLVEPIAKLGTAGLQYDFPELGVSFRLPAGYPAHNVFQDKWDGDYFPIIDTYDVKEASERAVGDGGAFVTSLWVDTENSEQSLEERVEQIREWESVVEESELTVGGQPAVKLVYESFGSTKLTLVFVKVGDRFYVFNTNPGEVSLLDKILETVEFAMPETKTVEDYFNEIPDQYFRDVSKAVRTGAIDVLDLENYYISFSPMEIEGSGSMTVFLHNGEHLIVTEMKGCGPACEQEIYFLRYDNGQFIDVTAQYLPDLDFSKEKAETFAEDPNAPFVPLFVLPRYGTTIEVTEQFSDEILYKLHWKKGKFEVEEV